MTPDKTGGHEWATKEELRMCRGKEEKNWPRKEDKNGPIKGKIKIAEEKGG
jgi:hypothetical protein